MKIIIKGDAKEITALKIEIQEREREKQKDNRTARELILQGMNEAICDIAANRIQKAHTESM